MKGIDNVRKHTDIECLLRNHHSEPEKDFIQKYAETKMAAVSNEFAKITHGFALLAFIAAAMLGVFLSGNQNPEIRPIYFWSLVFMFIIIAAILLFVYKKRNVNWLEAIIIAVQDAKFATQESVDSIVIYKLDEIIGRVDAINEKSNHLEKVVSTEFEIIKRDVVSLKKTEEP